MFPPVPAPFAGSVPQAFAEDHRLSRLLDRAFAAVAVFIGLCTGLQAGIGDSLTWPASLAAGCLAMLVPAAVGFWAIRRAGTLSSLTVARLYDRVLRHFQAPASGQAIPAIPESPIDSFAGLVSGSLRNLRRSLAAYARAREAAQEANQAVKAGRDKAGRLATHLRGDGAAMASAASGIMVASARLAEAAAQTSNGAAATEDAVAKVAEQAIGLTGSIRHVTGQITRMTRIAADSAEAAMGAQIHLAGLDARTRGLGVTVDQVSRALQRAGACGRQAAAHAASGEMVPAILTADLEEMAGSADEALSAMLAIVTGLRADTVAASRRVTDLSALIQSQHELGDALTHTIGQQSEDVAKVLGLIEEAHSGFATVRAGMDAMSSRNNIQLSNAEALRGSISRLPAHADTIADILRSIPDFAPPLEY